MSHRRQVTQAHQHCITERTGHKLAVWLNQGDFQARISTAQVLGTGRASKAAADYYDARRRLCPRQACAQTGQGEATDETQHMSTRQHTHDSPPPLAASASGQGSEIRCHDSDICIVESLGNAVHDRAWPRLSTELL